MKAYDEIVVSITFKSFDSQENDKQNFVQVFYLLHCSGKMNPSRWRIIFSYNMNLWILGETRLGLEIVETNPPNKFR